MKGGGSLVQEGQALRRSERNLGESRQAQTARESCTPWRQGHLRNHGNVPPTREGEADCICP